MDDILLDELIIESAKEEIVQEGLFELIYKFIEKENGGDLSVNRIAANVRGHVKFKKFTTSDLKHNMKLFEDKISECEKKLSGDNKGTMQKIRDTQTVAKLAEYKATVKAIEIVMKEMSGKESVKESMDAEILQEGLMVKLQERAQKKYESQEVINKEAERIKKVAEKRGLTIDQLKNDVKLVKAMLANMETQLERHDTKNAVQKALTSKTGIITTIAMYKCSLKAYAIAIKDLSNKKPVKESIEIEEFVIESELMNSLLEEMELGNISDEFNEYTEEGLAQKYYDRVDKVHNAPKNKERVLKSVRKMTKRWSVEKLEKRIEKSQKAYDAMLVGIKKYEDNNALMKIAKTALLGFGDLVYVLPKNAQPKVTLFITKSYLKQELDAMKIVYKEKISEDKKSPVKESLLESYLNLV